jgi:hypothetical protein
LPSIERRTSRLSSRIRRWTGLRASFQPANTCFATTTRSSCGASTVNETWTAASLKTACTGGAFTEPRSTTRTTSWAVFDGRGGTGSFNR